MDASQDDKHVPEVIKVENDDTLATAQPDDETTEPRVAVIGSGADYIPEKKSSRHRGAALGALLPYVLTLGALTGNSPFDKFGGGIGPKIKEALKQRKCALPECEEHFTPSRVSETCCSKEHFFILRDMQKLKAKIHQPKKKHKRKRK